MTLIQRQKTSLESEVERADERVKRYLEEKADVQSKFDGLRKSLEDKDAAFRQLTETCTVMDEQIRVSLVFIFSWNILEHFCCFTPQAFENMIESAEKSQKDVEGDRAKLLAEIEQLKQDVRTAKQQANEEKSLKLFSESKLRDVESRLRTIETDSDSRIDSLKTHNNEYAAMIKRFTQQVEDLEQQLADAELSLNSTARRVGVLDDENARLKVIFH